MKQLSLFDTEPDPPKKLDLSCLERKDYKSYAHLMPNGSKRYYERVEVPRPAKAPKAFMWRVSLCYVGNGLIHWHKGYYHTLIDAFEAFNKSEMIP